MSNNYKWKVYGCCLIIILIVGISLLIASFTYVEYNEYAFKKNTLKNEVETNRVYRNGRYLWGPNMDTILFRKDYQYINFKDLSVSDSDEKSFNIDASFFYKIKKGKLKELYSKFGTSYHSTIESKAQSTLKNTAPLYTIEQYLNNRTHITKVMNTNITEELHSIWIDLEEYKFFIKKITLQDTTINKYLDIAIQSQTNEQSEYEQEATAIRAETTRQVEEINTNATILTAEATAEAERLIAVAESQADLLTSTSRGQGIASIISNFSMDATTRLSFIKLMAIFDNSDVKIINTDNSIIIN